MKKNIFLLFGFLSVSTFLFSQNIYDLEHSWKYAGHLYSSGKFESAIREYERMLFFFPGNDSILKKLSLSCFQARNFKKAESFLQTIRFEKDSSMLLPHLLLLTGQYEKANIFLDNMTNEKKEIFSARLALHSANTKLYRKLSFPRVTVSEREQELFEKVKHFRTKKPVVALGLSIVPGLGKVYTGNYSDAVMSFLTVGICSFMAYRGFEKKGYESIPAWFYGGLGFGLYAGNFYGSFKAAKIRNKRFQEHVRSELEEIIISEN